MECEYFTTYCDTPAADLRRANVWVRIRSVVGRHHVAWKLTQADGTCVRGRRSVMAALMARGLPVTTADGRAHSPVSFAGCLILTWRTRRYAEPRVDVHYFGPQAYYVAPRDTAVFRTLDVYLAYRRPAWSRLATPPADVLAAVRFEPRDPVRNEGFTVLNPDASDDESSSSSSSEHSDPGRSLMPP